MEKDENLGARKQITHLAIKVRDEVLNKGCDSKDKEEEMR